MCEKSDDDDDPIPSESPEGDIRTTEPIFEGFVTFVGRPGGGAGGGKGGFGSGRS